MQNILSAAKIETVPTEALIPRATNAKRHPESQIAKLAGGIREFGFLVPILADADNNLIAGHGRVLAAQRLGMASVPVIRANHLSEAQRRALVLFENRVAESEWDKDMLKAEIEGLNEIDPEMLAMTGFDSSDLDSILQGLGDTEDFSGDADESQSGATVPTLKWGSHTVELTGPENDAMDRLIEQHIKQFGSTHGFVTHTLFASR